MSHDHPLISDLPPRTWHGWWLAWPKWFRIGCWAAAGMVLLHAALAVRISIGLQESAEIMELRQRSYSVGYFWEFLPNSASRKQPHPFDIVRAGLYGRSWGNIVEIESSSLTDDDLRLIGRKGRSLIRLELGWNDELTAEGLRELAGCHQLGFLDLHGADLDDESAQVLAVLGSLRNLDLSDTLVSDKFLPVLERMPLLVNVDVHRTDVTEAAAQEWRIRHHRPLYFDRARTELSLATEVLGSIRWSDGTRTARIPDGYNYRLAVIGPHAGQFRKTSASGLSRYSLHWEGRTWSEGDGEYTLKLRLGRYDSVPAIIRVSDGKPTAPTLEFVMPCTRAEALRSAKYRLEDRGC